MATLFNNHPYIVEQMYALEQLLKAGSQYDDSSSFHSISSVVIMSSLLWTAKADETMDDDGIETISILLSTTIQTSFSPMKLH